MLAMAAIALLVAACAGSGSDSSEAFGFLPIPTPTPAPTSTPITKHDRYDICPNLPRERCILAGDTVNVYEAYSLAGASGINVIHDGEDWIFGNDVQRILSMLDVSVEVRPGTVSQQPFFTVIPNWDPSEGLPPSRPLSEGTQDALTLFIDVSANVMRIPFRGELIAPLPEAFIAEIRSSFSDATPTQTPRPTLVPYTPRPPDPTRTPLVVPDDAPFFDHPDDRLSWDGPSDKVYSIGRAHCEAPEEIREGYGIPALIAIEDGDGYWAIAALPPPPALRWTGYQYDDWEIWQGDEPRTIYLLNTRLDNIVFEYLNFGCI